MPKPTVMKGRDADYRVDLRIDSCLGTSPETTQSTIREMKAAVVNVVTRC